MKTSLLILFASLAVAAAQPGSNYEWVSAEQSTSLYIVHCNVPTELQFIFRPGKGFWIERSPACNHPQIYSTFYQNAANQNSTQQGRVEVDGNIKDTKLKCQVFAVFVPGSHVKESTISSEPFVTCIKLK